VGSRGISKVAASGCGSGCSAVALVRGEPGGRISTTSAGLAVFEATLCSRPGDAAPAAFDLHEPPAGALFLHAAWDDGPAAAERRFSCEVRALRASALAAALDGLLRAITVHAALTDAVLEVRTVRLAEPVVYPAPLVGRLARDLWGAGFPVSFGPSWMVVTAGDVAVGTGGLEGAFECFLREHPAWCAVLPEAVAGRTASTVGVLDGRDAWG
jgi:hypothetical protein